MGNCICKEDPIDFQAEVELIHFELLRSVGKGAFGKVRIVQHKQTGKNYALKYINKAKCMKQKAVENIIQERRLLEEIHCPFVCNLRYAFQDDENMFMVLDLMLGGDLRFHLERMGTMPEDMVKFYVAEISSGLSYLHSKLIVHRDLKPDNVLLDENGHASITDFNIAVHYKEEKPLTAVAGSMAYMAPEVLGRKGYFNAVDWWSLGVVAFELLCGKRPFRGKTNEELTRAIMNEHLNFPSAAANLSEDAKNILKGFLDRNVETRLGSKQSGGDRRVRDHPWFSKIDWAKLEAKELPAPFVPDSKKANFDATHELEELLLEDNPLKAKPKKKKDDPSVESKADPNEDPKIAKYKKLMDEKFTVFDYTKPRLRGSALHIPSNSTSNLGPTPANPEDTPGTTIQMEEIKKTRKSNSMIGPIKGSLFGNGENKGSRASKLNMSNQKLSSNSNLNKGNSMSQVACHALPGKGGELEVGEMSIHHDPMEGREDAVKLDDIDKTSVDEPEGKKGEEADVEKAEGTQGEAQEEKAGGDAPVPPSGQEVAGVEPTGQTI
ncbi:hypothetical protein HDV05_002158 [Chytridiales sp. JEL 0842]|nr:hypothetical protein HDV05_002158 [Chytridiales sp. JEL 0842]